MTKSGLNQSIDRLNLGDRFLKIAVDDCMWRWEGERSRKRIEFLCIFYLFVGWGKKKRLVRKSANGEDGRLMS